MKNSEFLTDEQLQHRLTLSRAALHRYRNRADDPLPYVRIGDGPKAPIRYRWADVEAWLVRQKVSVEEDDK